MAAKFAVRDPMGQFRGISTPTGSKVKKKKAPKKALSRTYAVRAPRGKFA